MLAPALTAIALGLLLNPIGSITWEPLGYSISPERSAALALALLGVSAAALGSGAIHALRAYRKANSYLGAAQELDDLFDGEEQIVTLATLADPSKLESARARRTPLFPILWRRALMYFDGFDPKREFRLEPGAPLKRSTMFAGVVALAMIVATLGLVRAPSPEQALAQKLRVIAERIAKSATSPDDSMLAEKIREAAEALENSKLPPEEKKKKIQEAMQQADKAEQKRNNSQSGKDQGTGKSKSQNGKGSGKGEGQSEAGGKGSGQGNGGSGAGNSANGQGSGKNDKGNNKDSGKNNQSAKNDQNSKGDKQSIELQNDLAKAEAQVETAGAKNPAPDVKPGEDKDQGANKAGDNPNEKGGNEPNPNLPGDIPKPGTNGDRNMPAAGGNPKDNQDRGSNLGDTHLGETPTGRNYQRYLKPGEKGAALDIKDARYVMFRIPSAQTSKDGGKTVLDNGRPKASTAYVNAPLAPSSDEAPPDERQLVPPRYRDLIR